VMGRCFSNRSSSGPCSSLPVLMLEELPLKVLEVVAFKYLNCRETCYVRGSSRKCRENFEKIAAQQQAEPGQQFEPEASSPADQQESLRQAFVKAYNPRYALKTLLPKPPFDFEW